MRPLYTTIGRHSGTCGHRHTSIETAVRCLRRFEKKKHPTFLGVEMATTDRSLVGWMTK